MYYQKDKNRIGKNNKTKNTEFRPFTYKLWKKHPTVYETTCWIVDVYNIDGRYVYIKYIVDASITCCYVRYNYNFCIQTKK